MSKELPWHQIIQDTKKSALASAELSASLYRLARSLQLEAEKQQEENNDGQPNSPTTT